MRFLSRSWFYGLAAASVLWGFGQNKVQYDRFIWSYFQTRHFDIYYTQGGDSIAYFAASHVEEMHQAISKVIGHSLTDRVPIILHNSHAEFEQTNVIRMPLHEAIGGFTEIFKNRIVLPFEGDYVELYHVLKHEMVHAMMNDLFFGRHGSAVASRQGAFRLPLWVSEGLAEYVSLGWDLSSEFFMLDATTAGYATTPENIMGGFLAYKGGQMFFHFLESVYGEGTTRKWIREITKARNFEKAFKNVTKTSLEEAGEIWLRELRHIYWPELGQRQHGKSVGRKLTDHGRDLSFYNLQPSISPNNKEIAFFSDRKSREGVFILNLETEKVTRAVIQGGTEGLHESFHSFKSGLAWGPGSERLAIVSKSGGKDVIHIIDSKSGKVMEEIAPPLQGILSPTWSQDGRYIGFSGMNKGYTDIYVWDRDAKQLTRVTQDKAYDDKPTFSPSGRWIAFETDRASLDGRESQSFKDIFMIRPDGSGLRKVSSSAYDDKMPSYGATDSLLSFVSNRSGIDNIYVVEVAEDGLVESPITNLLSGCFTPSWSRDGSLMAFSLFEGGGWDIFLIKDPLSKKIKGELPKTHFISLLEGENKSFFRSPNWENLSSYQEDTTAEKNKDSLASTKTSLDSAKAVTIAGTDSLSGESEASEPIAAIDSSAIDTVAVDTLAIDTSALDTIPLALPIPVDTATAPTHDTVVSDTGDPSGAPQAAPEESEKTAAAPREDPRITRVWLDSSDYLDESGVFKKKTYTPKFSLDMAAAGVAVSNFDGSFGQGAVVLSDLMGDQEIQVQLSLGGNLENSNFALGYSYLPYKIDYMVGGFYSSLSSDIIRDISTVEQKSWGFYGGLIYPLSIYTRWQLEAPAQFHSQKYTDTSGIIFSENVESVSPSLSWSMDNIQWGIVGPVNGTRVQARVSATPPLFMDDIAFWVADLDVRRYWRFIKKYTVALRVNLGGSGPFSGYASPHRFWMGGDDFFTLFTTKAFVDTATTRNMSFEESFFSEFATPLRGFPYFEFRGNRKVLTNLEFRFPFVREFSIVWPIPIMIRYVTGVLFVDYGAVWDEGKEFWDNQGLGMGYGFRMNLGIFVLRWTRAWPHQSVGSAQKHQTDYWSLGAEF